MKRADAVAVLNEVTRRFRPWIRATGQRPSLVRNYEPYWGGGRIPYAILWEDGPSEWVHQLLDGEPDPELLAEGYRTKAQPRPSFPGVSLEAGTSFILCIFRAPVKDAD